MDHMITTDGKNRLVITGEEPHDFDKTIITARAMMRLPPWSPAGSRRCLTAVLAAMKPAAVRRFVKLIRLSDTDLPERFDQLREQYCGIAEPGAKSWPIPPPADILETVPANLGRLQGLVCTIDGKLLLTVVTDTGEMLCTPTEFECLFGARPTVYISEAAKRSSQELKKLAELLRSPVLSYQVSYSNVDMEVGDASIRARSIDQIKAWCERRALTLLDAHKENP